MVDFEKKLKEHLESIQSKIDSQKALNDDDLKILLITSIIEDESL
jgi:hypothetical protein